MLTPEQAARLVRRNNDLLFGPGRTAESVMKDMDAVSYPPGSPPGCRGIELAGSVAAARATAPSQAQDITEQVALIRSVCVDYRWSDPAIACFTALVPTLPASESARERCMAMLTPGQERYLNKHGADLFLTSSRVWDTEQLAPGEALPAATGTGGGTAGAGSAGGPELIIANLVGTWTYGAGDPMQGQVTLSIDQGGRFHGTHAPAHDGGCEIGGRAAIERNPNPAFAGNLVVQVAESSCGDFRARAWSVRAFDGKELTVVDELDQSRTLRVLRRH
jgi:hypothetical protein